MSDGYPESYKRLSDKEKRNVLAEVGTLMDIQIREAVSMERLCETLNKPNGEITLEIFQSALQNIVTLGTK